MIVLYHANCNDGFCSAWIWRKRYSESTFIPVHYGQKLNYEQFRDQDLVLLDFSFKKDVFNEVVKIAKTIVVLDHHKSFAEDFGFDLEDRKTQNIQPTINSSFWFNNFKSGAALTWEYFYGPIAKPELVKYVQDRDLWTKELPNCDAVAAAISSYPQDFLIWNTFNISALITEGKAIQRYQDNLIKKAVERSVKCNICVNGVTYEDIPVVNTTVLFSEIGEALSENKPFAVCWFKREDGKYQYSLRSRKDGEDVSKVAKAFPGGGGHKQAAGFETDNLIFNYEIHI